MNVEPGYGSVEAAIANVETAIAVAQAQRTRLPLALLAVTPHTGTAKVSILLNELCSRGDCRYLEFGVFHGRSLIAAAWGNTGQFTGVDHQNEKRGHGWPATHAMLPPDQSGTVRFVSANFKDVALDARYDVCFYDADHSALGTARGVCLMAQRLRPGILIVDDVEHPKIGPHASKGAELGLAQSGCRIAQTWLVPKLEGFHMGLLIYVVNAGPGVEGVTGDG